MLAEGTPLWMCSWAWLLLSHHQCGRGVVWATSSPPTQGTWQRAGSLGTAQGHWVLGAGYWLGFRSCWCGTGSRFDPDGALCDHVGASLPYPLLRLAWLAAACVMPGQSCARPLPPIRAASALSGLGSWMKQHGESWQSCLLCFQVEPSPLFAWLQQLSRSISPGVVHCPAWFFLQASEACSPN